MVRGSICTIGTTGFAYPPSRMEKVIKIKLINLPIIIKLGCEHP